jgi:hypothetical protein
MTHLTTEHMFYIIETPVAVMHCTERACAPLRSCRWFTQLQGGTLSSTVVDMVDEIPPYTPRPRM